MRAALLLCGRGLVREKRFAAKAAPTEAGELSKAAAGKRFFLSLSAIEVAA
jgi:hypothetical protein